MPDKFKKYRTKEIMIERLLEDDIWSINQSHDELKHILLNGKRGYLDMTDAELELEFQERFGEDYD
jgi:hypothetical protein